MNANVCTECGGAGVVNTWRDRAMATCPTCDGTGQRQRGDRSGDRAALEAEKGLATERVEAWLVDELQHQRDVARRLAAQWRNRARSAGVDGEYLPFPWEEGG